MKKGGKKQIMAIAGFAVMSGSILLMPLELGALSGFLFWGGLIWGCACQAGLRTGGGPRKWGVFRFFPGKPGKIVDTAMILLMAGAAAALAADGYAYLCCVLLAAAVFAFSLHCIVNSQNFVKLFGSETDRTQTDQLEPRK